MIKHVVCYKLADASEENIAKTKQVLESMVGVVPEVKALEVGVDVLHSARSYDLILQVTLESVAAMESYQSNEYHVSVVKKHMHSVVEKSVAVDYEF